MIYPGRATRSYRCRRCGAEVSFSVHFDWRTGKNVAVVSCENGHRTEETWDLGAPPPSLPVESTLEFVPTPRRQP
jgi:DNA-directed RNA polymerase subunit RPC12/RpoP